MTRRKPKGMRVCRLCRELLPIVLFDWHGRERDEVGTWCAVTAVNRLGRRDDGARETVELRPE
jgi:hypothetical protein